MARSGSLRVDVVRSGGFAGLTVAAEVLSEDLDEAARLRLDALLDQLGIGGAGSAAGSAVTSSNRSALPSRAVVADRFDYEVTVRRGRRVQRVNVSEVELAPAVRKGLEELLGSPSAGQ